MKLPAEVALGVSDLIFTMVANIILITVLMLIVSFIPGIPLMSSFIGACVGALVADLRNRDVRRNCRILWFWIKNKNDNFPASFYKSSTSKRNFEFLNLFNRKTTDTSEKDDLKKSAKKSLLDD